MTQLIAPQSHHPEGPSNWPAWAECPDFESVKDIDDADAEALEAEAGVDEKDAKVIGTKLHAALAKALTRQQNPFDGLTEKQEEQVRWAADTAIAICAEHGYSADEILVEQRVALIGPDFKEIYFGTGDILCGPLVFDFKSGDERNYTAQLIGYALPRMETLECDRIYAFALYGRWKRVRRFVITRDTAETVAYGILNKRRNPNRVPTVCSYCGWCSKKATCSALTGIYSAIEAKRNDWIVKLPHASVRQAAGDPVTAGALYFIWKAYLEPWGQGVTYLVKGMASNGIKPLGVSVRPEQGRTEFTSGDAVLLAMFNHIDDAPTIASAAKFSMTSLVKLWQEQYGGTEKAAIEKVTEILTKAGVMTRSEPTSKLIREKNAGETIAAALARNVTPTTNLLP